jgi:hypothetical protein
MPALSAPANVADFSVELPSGGMLHLQTPDEVQFWNESMAKYGEEYTFAKQNDLITLGMLLQQQVILFRLQTQINGMEPELDASDVPTGAYKRIQLDAGETSTIQKTMTATAAEMRALEKSLGIDKATREQGGTHTVDSYVKSLKRAAHVRGVHIAERTIEYEKVINELRVRLRLLYNGDAEDRKYHSITPKTILDWLREECARLEQVDKDFNMQHGKLFIGKL